MSLPLFELDPEDRFWDKNQQNVLLVGAADYSALVSIAARSPGRPQLQTICRMEECEKDPS